MFQPSKFYYLLIKGLISTNDIFPSQNLEIVVILLIILPFPLECLDRFSLCVLSSEAIS